MDFKKIAGDLLSSNSINGLSELTGTSGGDVTKVLGQALPALLAGANNQAKGNNTSESFVSALADHAKNDTNDLGKFLGNVDTEDGAKIISHLLGSDKNKVIKDISKSTGVSNNNTAAILSAIAPLLMSLLGQQAEEEKDSDITSLFGSLLDNVNTGNLLAGLLGANSGSSEKEDNGSLLTGLLTSLLK